LGRTKYLVIRLPELCQTIIDIENVKAKKKKERKSSKIVKKFTKRWCAITSEDEEEQVLLSEIKVMS
jgi:hypothetical protein